MPVAGDEGYETLVVCPYDKAHEIRKGRLQFHLDKCRKNFPSAQKVQCPLNATHIIPSVELEYHLDHECNGKLEVERDYIEIEGSACPVSGLVPINAGSVPEFEESWDDCESKGSVLESIKQQAEEKDILRYKQCAPKSERAAFRRAEQQRFERLQREARGSYTTTTAPPSVVSEEGPLSRPKKSAKIPLMLQDPHEAIAAINSGMREISLKDASMKNNTSIDSTSHFSTAFETALSETASNGPSVTDEASSVMSYASASKSYATAFASKPASVAPGISSRPSTAMSIANSVGRARGVNKFPPAEDGFCQIPIPGLGRGRKGKK